MNIFEDILDNLIRKPLIEYNEYIIETEEQLKDHPGNRLGDMVSVPRPCEFVPDV